MTDELVERLRKGIPFKSMPLPENPTPNTGYAEPDLHATVAIMIEAAAEIAALKAQVAEARALVLNASETAQKHLAAYLEAQDQIAEARGKAFEEAAKVMDAKNAAWQESVARYRARGNYGPYLGGPSYSDAAQAIRDLAGEYDIATGDGV